MGTDMAIAYPFKELLIRLAIMWVGSMFIIGGMIATSVHTGFYFAFLMMWGLLILWTGIVFTRNTKIKRKVK